MMNRTAAGIFGIIMAAQLCLTPYAGVNVQAAQQEEEQLFEDASESDGSFEDVSDADVQSAENPANELTASEYYQFQEKQKMNLKWMALMTEIRRAFPREMTIRLRKRCRSLC